MQMFLVLLNFTKPKASPIILSLNRPVHRTDIYFIKVLHIFVCPVVIKAVKFPVKPMMPHSWIYQRQTWEYSNLLVKTNACYSSLLVLQTCNRMIGKNKIQISNILVLCWIHLKLVAVGFIINQSGFANTFEGRTTQSKLFQTAIPKFN
jgi:hypothetical protein